MKRGECKRVFVGRREAEEGDSSRSSMVDPLVSSAGDLSEPKDQAR